jgi:DNA-directed RNA polymerase subunit E'/Rpb7
MIPSDITFDANATPPQWTDNGEQVIEKGTNIRIKIKGLRSEVDKMYAVGTMKEVNLHALRPALVPQSNQSSRITLAHYLHSFGPRQPYIGALSGRTME